MRASNGPTDGGTGGKARGFQSGMAGEGRAPGGGGPARWEIEVHLARGTVLRREARGEGARQAIEAVLARCDFRPAQVSGIAAYPRLDGRGA